MEEAPNGEFNFDAPPYAPPPWISLSPFPPLISPSPRRLSSHFTPPTRPVRAAKQLAWVSLQGRLVGAEEASSAKAIGGGLSPEEAVAWELFSPMHRVLIVAVIAVAAANSKKNRQIFQLKKSVEIRDEVLLGMQQKLDDLCEQVNYFKDQPDISSYNFKFSGCGCRLCNHHHLPSISIEGDYTTNPADEEDMIKYKLHLQNDEEPEERRMSDLSDWAPSISSSIDVQWNTRSIEQNIENLQKECEDKDVKIKELSDVLKSAESLGSKRIVELEDIIRRKNMIITKLRKDMVVLEQKVIHLTRLRRPSSKSSSSLRKLPPMADNLIYDMDSTSSPSSSDSDCSAKKNHQQAKNKNENRAPLPKNNKDNDHSSVVRKQQKPIQFKSSELIKSRERSLRGMIPLKEQSLNQQFHLVNMSKSKLKDSSSGDCKSRNGTSSTSSRVSSSHKRWV